MSDFNYKKYIDDVSNNRILVCDAVKLAVQRHIKDIENSKNKNFEYYFDEEEAQRPIIFIQNLNHSKGKWAIEKDDKGKSAKIKLEGWQQFIIASVFGWRKKSDKLRRFRKVYIQVARKNGKTTLLSGVANYCFFCDSPKEPGVEVYFIATKKEQAKLAWEDMERMIRKCSSLKGLTTTYKQTSVIIKKSDSASKAKILGQDSNTEDGLNPHFIGVDEFHAHPSDELINVLESGTGARRQPLTFIITTAGFDKNSVCFKEYTYLKSILNDTITNDTYFAMIFEPDETDDWKSREAIIKSNPNLNISASEEMILNRITESLDKPHQQVDVKTKNINIWTQSSTTWISLEVWESGNTVIDFEKLKNEKCTIGLDLSTTIDITAVAFCFKQGNKYIFKMKYFMPGLNIRERSQEDKVPYELWAEQGYITLTENKKTINFDMVEDYIREEGLKKYDVIKAGYDAWKSHEVITHLENDGLEMVGIRQSFALGGISEATSHFERLVYEKRIIHSNDPVLKWMLTNTEVVTDGKDNWRPVKPDRKKSVKRIDGILAAMMSLLVYIQTENEISEGSVYDNAGLFVI